jgi:hypothetical protein
LGFIPSRTRALSPELGTVENPAKLPDDRPRSVLMEEGRASAVSEGEAGLPERA